MPTVLVIRQFDNFSRILTEKGFSVMNCPTIETVESENLPGLAAKVAAKNYDGIFLTSRKATEIALEKVFAKNLAFGGRIYVLGKSSFDLLKSKDLNLFFVETVNTAREMLEAIPREDLKGKRFLFIRGDKSLGTIREFLNNSADLDEEIVYETREIAVEDDLRNEIEAKLKNSQIAAACFFSPSGAESFFEQFDSRVLHQTKIATIGKTTAEFFAGRDLKVDFIPQKATAEDFAIELTDYLRKIISRG